MVLVESVLKKLMPRNPKAGIGIAEILVASVVLGFLLVALSKLQLSNRESVIRTRSRDAAVEIAQEVLDSLSAVGVAALHGDGNTNTINLVKQREWKQTPGDVETTSRMNYTVRVEVSPDEDFQNREVSKFDTTRHVYARRLNVNVSWIFKGTPTSINVTGMVR
ncbi:MAG: type II secretion system protein [Fibrobacter sp.]|nr:type II secretion system protein [Fibrobacter sp.]